MNSVIYRRTLRWLHILFSLILGTYLYSPWSSNPVFEAVVLFAVFPLMGLGGLAMWQQGRILRILGKG